MAAKRKRPARSRSRKAKFNCKGKGKSRVCHVTTADGRKFTLHANRKRSKNSRRAAALKAIRRGNNPLFKMSGGKVRPKAGCRRAADGRLLNCH